MRQALQTLVIDPLLKAVFGTLEAPKVSVRGPFAAGGYIRCKGVPGPVVSIEAIYVDDRKVYP